jgi:hypothetical protein
MGIVIKKGRSIVLCVVRRHKTNSYRELAVVRRPKQFDSKGRIGSIYCADHHSPEFTYEPDDRDNTDLFLGADLENGLLCICDDDWEGLQKLLMEYNQKFSNNKLEIKDIIWNFNLGDKPKKKVRRK